MGKTLSEIRADLRTDLDDSGALWSDTELDRSVERAVADLSRFLPNQKVYEETIDVDVDDESFTTPAAADPDAIVDAEDISASSAGDTCTITDVTPDVPRQVAVLITDADASITAFTIIVKGTNKDGDYITESFYFNGGLSQTGKKYFKTVTEVEIDAITGSGASDTLDVGTTNAYDAYIYLANKPIKPKSETITNAAGTTTYSRDTDYTMDYANGGIKFINGGSMAAATSYLADYTKSKIQIDLSPIKYEFIRIDRVEYPTHNIPQSMVSADLWGDILTITGDIEGQEQMSDDNHIAIYYYAKHTPPAASAPGSYPDFLDETIILAASAYALFNKAVQYEHQAVTDLASVRTELGLTTAVHTLADAALDKVITYLENNTNEDAKYWLTKITTDIAGLRTAIGTAVDAANTYLDAVAATDIDAATVGATAWLLEGELLINAVNVGGQNVAPTFADYARAKISIANARTNSAIAYIQEATTRLSNLRSYIEQAGGWTRVAETFIAEATGRIAEMDRYLTEAAQYADTASADMALANMFRAEAVERRNEAWAIWRDPKQYIGDPSSTALRQPAVAGVTARVRTDRISY